MYGSDWNWCDAVEAIAAIITPILGSGLVIQWFQNKRVEAIRSEESRNMQSDAGSNVDVDDPIHEFWALIQRNVPGLAEKSIPTRRFWSLPFKKGIRLVYVVSTSSARVELYIDNGDRDWNLRVYDQLKRRKSEIERIISRQTSEGVIWFDRLDSRAKGIGIGYEESGLKDQDRWGAVAEFYKRATSALKSVAK